MSLIFLASVTMLFGTGHSWYRTKIIPVGSVGDICLFRSVLLPITELPESENL